LEDFARLAKIYAPPKLASLDRPAKLRAGRGVGAGEAPRGTLYHEYTVDQKGVIVKCNIITPTAQFLFNIEHDLNKYLAQIKGKSLADQKKETRRMIRAYDPCISCATH
jgi:sulfhydrogenase subunit alpha